MSAKPILLPTFALPSGNGSSSVRNYLKDNWQRKKKSHHSSPHSSLSFPSSKQQSHRPLQFTVLLSALLSPFQRQEKWRQEQLKSLLKIPASWGKNIQSLSHMKNTCKNRIKTLLSIFGITEGWKKQRTLFTEMCPCNS